MSSALIIQLPGIVNSLTYSTKDTSCVRRPRFLAIGSSAQIEISPLLPLLLLLTQILATPLRAHPRQAQTACELIGTNSVNPSGEL